MPDLQAFDQSGTGMKEKKTNDARIAPVQK
jgi:hypothetical protein